MEALGHLIDDWGIHADADKMEKIRQWKTPWDLNEVQWFLGLVEYLALFLPEILAWTSPLSGICGNGQPFTWQNLHQKCFEEIKCTICRAPILKPINWNADKPVWVITDACPAGVGAILGQGLEWQTCQPAAFMSKKFMAAQ